MIPIPQRKLALLAALVLPTALGAADMPKSIATAQSALTVHVFKAGLFSAFGHEHEISAPITQGSFTEQNPSVELTVDARKLRVMDKDVSEKDRADIQQTMLGPKVLDSERFPEIRFRSTAVAPAAEGKWAVQGNLTIHGETRPVRFEVALQNGHYRGTTEIKQKDFGITPVTVGGGAVKVKNELRVEFDIVGQ
ncbi:MAG: YceI family protein [Acidobacteriia bacterium]|nr:YceI family protein [Terriglobia bacterium]